MKVKKVVVAEGMGGFYFDDLAAIKQGAKVDGHFILGDPVTAGHKKIRNPGETISIMLVMDSGDVALGSCAAIQYSGVVGRDPILLGDVYIPFIKEKVIPLVEGTEINSFREASEWFDKLIVDGKRLHTGIRYGFTQAFLGAIAQRDKVLPAEVIAKEYNTEIRKTMIPILAQSADDRYRNADKMIIKKVPSIPQGLFNSLEKVGKKGEKLEEYVTWLTNRVKEFGDKDYFPIYHLDVYGIPGKIFNNDIKTLTDYFMKLEKLSAPYPLDIECPIDTGDRDSTINIMVELLESLHAAGSKVCITADDWCNTLEDIKYFVDKKAADMIQVKTPDLGGLNNSVEAAIYVKNKGLKCFLGGTCNESDISSRYTVNAALATNCDMVYNKPGMGVDEGYMIVFNEMQRVLAMLNAKDYWNNG